MLQHAVMALVWFCAGDLLEELCGSAHGIDLLLLRTGVKRAGKNLCGFFFFFSSVYDLQSQGLCRRCATESAVLHLVVSKAKPIV